MQKILGFSEQAMEDLPPNHASKTEKVKIFKNKMLSLENDFDKFIVL